MGVIDILKKMFIQPNIAGKGNEVVNICNGMKHKLYLKSSRSQLDIVGSGNKIIFHSDRKMKKFPSGLNLKIRGDNNIINIELPITFEDVLISMDSDNTFEILSQIYSVTGARFYVEEGADVVIGRDCELCNGNLHVVVNNGWKKRPKLSIGNRVHIARDCIIRTSDGQAIIDLKSGLAINEPKDVIIEDDVWITSRCIILKGSYIAKGNIVGAGSLVNKQFFKNNVVLAGAPAKIIKENVFWSRETFGQRNKRIVGSNVV